MKRILTASMLLLAAAAIGWYFWVSDSKRSGNATNIEPSNAVIEPQAVVRSQIDQSREQVINENDEMVAFEKRIGRKFTGEEKRLKPPGMSWAAWGQYVDLHRQDSYTNGPITFYGIVVSPDGEPIPAVTVTAEIRQYIESIAEKLLKGNSTELKRIPLVTDDSGRFSIEGETGTNLQVFDFNKKGYEIIGEKKYWGRSFNPHAPNHHQPDPGNPEVFTMRKVE